MVVGDEGPISYDAPPSNTESDFSDPDYASNPRQSSSDAADDDRHLLEDDEERNELLIRHGTRARHSSVRTSWGREKPHRRDEGLIGEAQKDREKDGTRKRNRRRGGERRELLHSMEEGGDRSRTPSSDASSDAYAEKIGREPQHRKVSRAGRLFKFTLLHAIIALVFLAIAFGAYKATKQSRRTSHNQTLTSNGTSLFLPTTILISLDGFRADYLRRGLTPTLNRFIREGISPKYMTPSFPSVTFPNHFTLVTGLYPESHGVVGNSFWDTDLGEEFYYTNKSVSMQPKWWLAEPIWETAEMQGVRTAIHMWPGSEAHIGDMEPMVVDKYNGSEIYASKVRRILEFLDKHEPQARERERENHDEDKHEDEHEHEHEQPDAHHLHDRSDPSDTRPQLIAAYVPNVDADGHKYGPNSTEIRRTIMGVDTMLESLFEGIEHRNLTNIVNVIVVSDHGMATTSTDRVIQLEDLIDVNLIAHIDGWPHYGLRPKHDADIPRLHQRLTEEAANREGFDVYLRDEDMPERYHFKQSPRIAPLWIMPHAGWAVVTKDEMDVAEARRTGEVYHPRGIHGYDHEHPLMRAIFVARGPAFPHEAGSRVDVFQNTEVYNVVCDSVGVDPRPNNGTLRLPFRTVGLHDDVPDYATGPEIDLPASQSAPDAMTSVVASGPIEPVTAVTEIGAAASASVTPMPVPSRPVVSHTNASAHGSSSGSDVQDRPKTAAEFWEWAKERYARLAQWMQDMIRKHKDQQQGEHKEGEEKHGRG